MNDNEHSDRFFGALAKQDPRFLRMISDHEHTFVGHPDGVQCKDCGTPFWYIDPLGNRRSYGDEEERKL